MIYPEFRLHSIAFAYRSLIVMLIQWVCLRYGLVYPLLLRGVVVLLTMYLADLITSAHRDQGTTMRAMPFPEYVPTGSARDAINTYYSVCQIFATTQVVFALYMDQVFAVVFPVQLAAFLMTCVRKSIISAGAWHLYYALSLLSNFVIAFYVAYNSLLRGTANTGLAGAIFWVVSLAAVFVRFNSRISKYLVWTVLGLGVHCFCVLVLGKYDRVLV